MAKKEKMYNCGYQTDIACPFFEAYNKRENTVCCEDEYSVAFPDDETATVYRAGYCANAKGYMNCLIARVLEEKYDPITAEQRNRP